MAAKTQTDAYDTPWKSVLIRYFREFLAHFFTELQHAIDWSRTPRFIDKELPLPLARNRIADLLVQVRCNGAPLLIHIEIQATRDSRFSQRILTYNHRIFERYNIPVVSLAILADAEPQWRPAAFGFGAGSFGTLCRFGTAKLIDFAGAPPDSGNIFALLTAAHLAALRTKQHPRQRLACKLELLRLLYTLAWSDRRIMDAYQFIDWVLKLPPAMERQFLREAMRYEREKHMSYVTSAERIGREEGMKQGRQQGLERGLEQGLEQGLERGMQLGWRAGQSELLLRQLTRRFGELPATARQKLAAASLQQLALWADALLDARSLDDVLNA